MKQVIQLLRVSTEAQAAEDRQGIPAQREACRRLCQQHGLTVRHEVQLTNVSGSMIMTTSEMQQIIKLLQTGQYHGIVVREFSRVLRPVDYDFYLFTVMTETRTTLYTESGVIEPWTDTGRMMVTLHGLMASQELSYIKRRMMAGKEELRRQGRWAAGKHMLPLGVDYDRETGKFSYNADAQRVKKLFKRFLGGQTNYDLLSRDAGVSRGTARNLLENPIYKGMLVYDKKRDERKKYKSQNGEQPDRPKVARAESEVIRVKVLQPSLVKAEDWDKVQRIIQRNVKARVRARVRVGEFTYSGFLVCGKCGRPMHCSFNMKHHYYACSGKKHRDENGEFLCRYTGYINRDKLEPELDRWVEEVLTRPARLRKVVQNYRQQLENASNGGDRKRMEEQLKKLTVKRDRYVEMYADGTISRAERDAKLTDVEGRIRTVEEDLRRVLPNIPQWSAQDLSKVLEPLRQWSVLTRKHRRDLLNALRPVFRVRGTKVLSVELAGSVVDSRMKTGP